MLQDLQDHESACTGERDRDIARFRRLADVVHAEKHSRGTWPRLPNVRVKLLLFAGGQPMSTLGTQLSKSSRLIFGGFSRCEGLFPASVSPLIDKRLYTALPNGSAEWN